MIDNASAARMETGRDLSSRKNRFIFFSDGILELLLFCPFLLFGLFRYFRILEQTGSASTMATVAMFATIALGLAAYFRLRTRGETTGSSIGMVVQQPVIVISILFLYSVLELKYPLDLPHISFAFQFIILATLWMRSKMLRFAFFLGWILFSHQLMLYLVNSSVGLGIAQATLLYNFLAAGVLVLAGLWLFIRYTMNPPALEDTDERFASEFANNLPENETEPGMKDFLKAEALMKKVKTSFLDDGALEIFLGFLFFLTGFKQIVEIKYAGILSGYTIGMYATLIIAMLLMGGWSVYRMKIAGIAVPGLDYIIGPVVLIIGLILGDRFHSFYITGLIWAAMFVFGAKLLGMSRCYIYAGWSLVATIMVALLGVTLYRGMEFDQVNYLVIIFSPALLLVGIGAMSSYYKKHIRGRTVASGSRENNGAGEVV